MRGLLLFFLLVSTAVSATPFLTSDLQCYDPSGANRACPSGYLVTEDYVPDDPPESRVWVPLGHEITDTSIKVWADMEPYATGNHSLGIIAVNSWGESEIVPFDLYDGVLAGPSGLRLVAPPGG